MLLAAVLPGALVGAAKGTVAAGEATGQLLPRPAPPSAQTPSLPPTCLILRPLFQT